MRHCVKRALCLLVSLSVLLTLTSVLTLSTTASPSSSKPMISVGDKFMVVQTESGEIWGWGDNSSGVLGNAYSDTTGTNITSPVKLELPSGVTSVSVSAGSDHVLMLGSDGNVYAWGNNEAGQLGVDNGGISLTNPTLVAGLSEKEIVAVSAGQRFSLALSESGRVYSFGLNDKLQLGYTLADSATSSPMPAQVTALSNVFVTKINAGVASATVIDVNEKVYLWGNTANYLLGSDDQVTPAEPFALPSTKTTAPIVASDLSSTHSAYLQKDGKIGFMGVNEYGQYGNSDASASASKRFKVTDTSALNVSVMAVSEHQTVLLTIDGKVYTAGAKIPNDAGSASDSFTLLFSGQSPIATAIDASYQNGALIAQDGSVWAWGDNSRGQLGNGAVGDGQAMPIKVSAQNGSDFDMGQAPSVMGVPMKFTTSVPAPTYSIVIPSTIKVDDLRQTSETDPDRNSLTKFTVEANGVANLYGEKEIQISVSSKNANGEFYLQDGNGATLPFDLLATEDAQTPISSGDVLARFTENGSVDTWIRIDRSKISKSGVYNGVLVFSYSLVDSSN